MNTMKKLALSVTVICFLALLAFCPAFAEGKGTLSTEQVKIFSYTYVYGTMAEEKINEWLKSHPGVIITKRIVRAYACGPSLNTNMLIVIIFYAEK